MTTSPSGDGDTAAGEKPAETTDTDAEVVDPTLSSSSTSPSPTVKRLMKRKSKNGVKKNNQKALSPPERRKKSLIRKRPVTFGNPALGTYHGLAYTLDEIGEDYSPTTGNNRPIIEGAESVERVVAMVDVPPEEVPEGVLNLARSHRPFLYHVRIMIAENKEDFQMNNDDHENEEDANDTSEKPINVNKGGDVTIGGKEETKEEHSSFHSAAESAASILAADTEQQPQSTPKEMTNGTTESYPKTGNDTLNFVDDTTSNESFTNNSVSTRTYLVLFELCSIDAAEAFVEDLHGKPYTSLDPTQKCSVHQVLALAGEDGVSLLSPFFAPSAKTTAPKGNKKKNNAAGQQQEQRHSSTASTTAKPNATVANATAASATVPVVATATVAQSAPIVEDYNCAVCLEHMNLTEAENDNDTSTVIPSSILTTVCNHTFHLDCLLQWQDSPCPVCRYDHSGLNEALSQCNVCGRTENNYVCLICGCISCGGASPNLGAANSAGHHTSMADRMTSHSPVCGMPAPTTYHHNNSNSTLNNSSSSNNNTTTPPSPMDNSRQLSQSHARKHYDDTLHAYALDTDTQHVWDFAGRGYVHRLLQNKEDGKLVEFHNPSNTSSHERSLNPGLSDNQEDEVVHRKLEGFASQYYTLLKSQLEQQRTYYQGRLQELRRESLTRKKAQTSDLIHALRQEKAQLSKRLVSLKARYSKVVEDIGFLKNMNESIQANKEPVKRKIRDAQRQRNETKAQIQECHQAMEETVTQLMLQLTGETAPEESAIAASNDDSASVEAASANPKTLKHSDSSMSDDKKPAAKK